MVWRRRRRVGINAAKVHGFKRFHVGVVLAPGRMLRRAGRIRVFALSGAEHSGEPAQAAGGQVYDYLTVSQFFSDKFHGGS